MLSPTDLAHFRDRGYVRVPGAIPRELALSLQDEVWSELAADHGIARDDRSTWKQPRRSPRGSKQSDANHALDDGDLARAISDVVGRDDWPRPPTWGGFLVTFPYRDQLAASPDGWTFPPEDAWHWDGDPDADGVLVVSFYSSVAPGGGGTRVLAGSHHVIRSLYASLSPEDRARPHRDHRRMLAASDPWLTELMRKGRGAPGARDDDAPLGTRATVTGVECEVVELTGEPGDVVLCNLGILHTPSPNLSDVPRIMRVKFLTLDGAAP